MNIHYVIVLYICNIQKNITSQYSIFLALWNDSVYFENPTKMEPIGGCDKAILREERRLKKPNQHHICCVCGIGMGTTVKCIYCPHRFHASCGRNMNFTLHIDIGKNGLKWNAVCPNH